MTHIYRRLGCALAAGALLLAGCSSSGDSGGGGGADGPPEMEAATEVGDGEGELNLIAWAGYAEDGSNDPTIDWVTPFEQETGCQVNVKLGNTSDEMVQLMRTGQYDGVSASGDATLRLIYAGDVAPVNTELTPNYATVVDFLKDKPWNSVDGQMYGVPHGWGANLLMYNTEAVTPAPDSWGAVFPGAPEFKGKLTAYDSPIYIADAALYLSKTQPDLGINDPYSLTSEQLDAAVELLKAQKENIGEYWSDYTKEVQAFESGATVVGTSWQVIANTIEADGKVKIGTVLPKEGSTGWSDTWMLGAKAAHPNCMYKWMDYIISPEANAQVAEYFGEAPSQTKSCDLTADTAHCATYHADDADYAAQIHYWTTPQTKCVDGSGDNCTSYDEWVTKWQEIKGLMVSTSAPRVRNRAALAFLLIPPLAWLIIAYLGSLAVLLVSAFWGTSSFTGAVVHTFTTDNLVRVLTDPVIRTVALRTLGVAVAVTVVCALLAVPLALFMAKFASPTLRIVLVVAVTTPLWASYLVKAYAWRMLLAPDGPLSWATGWTPGYGLVATVLTLTYLWLPYMVIPVFAAFQRVPDALVDASSDLGASDLSTLRLVVAPMVFPGIAAGSIFTFSLSLGDYIAVTIVGGKTQMLGNVIYGQLVTANNQPMAAALSLIPLMAIVFYLVAMRRTGALENV